MKNVIKLLAVAGLLGIVLTGCNKAGKQKSAAAGNDARLENVVWQLIQLNGTELSKPDKYEVTFAAGRATGIGECNRFFGPYELLSNPGTIKMGNMASTMMACLGEHRESEFLNMFGEVNTYQFDGNKLYFFTGSQPKAVAIFVDSGKTPVKE